MAYTKPQLDARLTKILEELAMAIQAQIRAVAISARSAKELLRIP